MKRMAFLASPYSHHDLEVRRERYERNLAATRWLINNGWHCFSPISYSVPLVEFSSRQSSHTWALFNYRMIDACDFLMVFCIEGWMSSHGVQDELKYAKASRKPVLFLLEDPDETYRVGTTPY